MEYRGPKDLIQYYIESYSMTDNPNGKGGADIVVEITFKRTVLNAMLTAILPSAAVCIVSFSTNFYKVSTRSVSRMSHWKWYSLFAATQTIEWP